MGETDPTRDPGGSESLYGYFLRLLSWLGAGQPSWRNGCSWRSWSLAW
jgi:hypothetical protein